MKMRNVRKDLGEKRIEQQFVMTANKTCETCGNKYSATGTIKSITRKKICSDCKQKNIKRHNYNYREKHRGE